MPSPLTTPVTTETPRLLLAGFGPFPQAPDNPAGRVVERLIAQAWSPAGARLSGKVVPVSWSRAPEEVLAAAQTFGCDAILLLASSSRAQDVRVEMRAQNRVGRRRADGEGLYWEQDRILPTGPGVVRATAPVAEMVQAIKAAGLPARASSESGDFVGNFTLYRLLAELGEGAGRAVGCLGIPLRLDLDDVERAVKAAAEAFASRLSALRPTRISA